MGARIANPRDRDFLYNNELTFYRQLFFTSADYKSAPSGLKLSLILIILEKRSHVPDATIAHYYSYLSYTLPPHFQ